MTLRAAETILGRRVDLFTLPMNVRFRRIVRPGDTITLSVELERLSARGGWGKGRATVDDKECA